MALAFPKFHQRRARQPSSRIDISLLDALPDDLMSEADFQTWLEIKARAKGWRYFHDQDSRRNAPGLPDTILLRPGRLIFAELKSEKGRLRPEQKAWRSDLETIDGIEVCLWRPRDRSAIEALLQ